MEYQHLTLSQRANMYSRWFLLTCDGSAIVDRAANLAEARHKASRRNCIIRPNRHRDIRLSKALTRGGYTALNAAMGIN